MPSQGPFQEVENAAGGYEMCRVYSSGKGRRYVRLCEAYKAAGLEGARIFVALDEEPRIVGKYRLKKAG